MRHGGCAWPRNAWRRFHSQGDVRMLSINVCCYAPREQGVCWAERLATGKRKMRGRMTTRWVLGVAVMVCCVRLDISLAAGGAEHGGGARDRHRKDALIVNEIRDTLEQFGTEYGGGCEAVTTAFPNRAGALGCSIITTTTPPSIT